MILHSIRFQLQLWHGLLLVLVLSGFGWLAYRGAAEDHWRRVDQELNEQMMWAFRPPPGMGRGAYGEMSRRPAPPGPSWIAPPPAPGTLPPPPDPEQFRSAILERLREIGSGDVPNLYYCVLFNAEGQELLRTAGAPEQVPLPQPAFPDRGADDRASRSGPFLSAVRNRGDYREVYRFLPMGDRIVLGRSIATDRAALRQRALYLFGAGLALLGIGLFGGWWLTSRALRPVQIISETAARISEGDLSRRIDTSDTRSELGQLVEVLNRTFGRLEEAFERQARFTSDASHELRTPITVMLSQIQTALHRERQPAEYRETLWACQRAAQRMRRLTESLLALAKLDAGQEQLQKERFDLSIVAQESVELVRAPAQERGIEILCDLPPVACDGDAERIGQVALNLLTNAVVFNRRPGRVTIKASRESDGARLTVTDTGPGIPSESLPHIFERFYRVDKSRSHSLGGSGLGLSICKAIVDAHGGTLTAESELGVGSTFTVLVPDAKPATAAGWLPGIQRTVPVSS